MRRKLILMLCETVAAITLMATIDIRNHERNFIRCRGITIRSACISHGSCTAKAGIINVHLRTRSTFVCAIKFAMFKCLCWQMWGDARAYRVSLQHNHNNNLKLVFAVSHYSPYRRLRSPPFRRRQRENFGFLEIRMSARKWTM